MAKIYLRKILDKNSNFTIEDVPNRWKKQVEELLKQQKDEK